MGQPIIRGIQAVGSVDIIYKYNPDGTDHTLDGAGLIVKTDNGIKLSGFRLDSEFLRANPQIASSIVIPILGGGGLALTNNNKTGTLSIRTSQVSVGGAAESKTDGKLVNVVDQVGVYSIVDVSRAQMSRQGGDPSGAKLLIHFEFSNRHVFVMFEGVTVARVDPIALAGNDAPDYGVQLNYLNWGIGYGAASTDFGINASIDNDGHLTR